MKKLFIVLTVLIGVVYFSRLSLAAEHPGEHPGEKAEHKEHPGEKAMLSAEQIIKGIKGHIQKVTEVNNGVFPLYDSVEGKNLRLKLVKVHEDRVSYIKKDDAYFACTDFKTEDGKATYDIDFWMKKNAQGELEVYKTKIHKKDGNPRFVYKEDEIVPVESEHMAPEQHSGHMAPEQHS